MRTASWLRGGASIAVATLVAALALAGCSGSAASPAVTVRVTVTPEASAIPSPTATPTARPTAIAQECSQLAPGAIEEFGATVQLLARVDEDTLPSLADGTLGLDLDTFDADVNRMRALEATAGPGAGDLREALDFYSQLSQAVRGLIAKGDQASDADLAAYAERFGGASGIVGAQRPIVAAYDASCR